MKQFFQFIGFFAFFAIYTSVFAQTGTLKGRILDDQKLALPGATVVLSSLYLGIEFIISVGDNFYTNGVASVDDPMWKTSFEDIYKGANLFIDWYPVLGNHDYRGNPQAQIDYSKRSRRWKGIKCWSFFWIQALSNANTTPMKPICLPKPSNKTR